MSFWARDFDNFDAAKRRGWGDIHFSNMSKWSEKYYVQNNGPKIALKALYGRQSPFLSRAKCRPIK